MISVNMQISETSQCSQSAHFSLVTSVPLEVQKCTCSPFLLQPGSPTRGPCRWPCAWLRKSQAVASCSCQSPKGLFRVPPSRECRHSLAQQSDGGGGGVHGSILASSKVLPSHLAPAAALVPNEWAYSLGFLKVSESHFTSQGRREGGGCEGGREPREGGKPGQGLHARALGSSVNPAGPLLES